MARMIDADAAKAALLGWDTDPTDEEIEYTIDRLPTVDAVEVVHGRWMLNVVMGYDCSCCGKNNSGFNCKSNYCPNCGAKMDLEE